MTVRSCSSRPVFRGLAVAVLLAGCVSEDGNGAYFPAPGPAWERRTPEEVGMDPDLVSQAVEYAKAHDSEVVPYDYSGHEEKFGPLEGPLPEERGGPAGLILRHGYIVAEWGDTERADLTFSVTKSFVSTMTGLAYDRGLIESTKDPIARYVTDGKFDSEHNAKITWEILLQQTSEWEGTLFGKSDTADFYHRRGRELPRQEPGTYYEYNDVRVNLASYATLMVWRRSLAELMKELVMDPIGASDSWTWHGYRTSNVEIDGRTINSVAGGGHWGGGLWIGARDMARFGYLFLRGGQWDGEQLISPEWIQLATTPSQRRGDYGYMWWLTPDENAEPGTPATTYAARGYGSNIIWIDTVLDLVVVLRWFGGRAPKFFDPLIQSVGK
ncbi:MAG: serine hydrolase [Gemmatimonadetes bacterium]|nr:serine hydrolase [Gemmatimonadota bacterium]